MTRPVAHRRLRLLAGGFAALVLVLAAGSVWLELQRTRHHAIDAAEQVAGALADAAGRAFATAAAELDEAARSLVLLDPARATDRLVGHELLVRAASRFPLAASFDVLDASGRLLHTSRTLDHQGTDDADREHFRIHVRDPSREVRLSAPAIGRTGFVRDRPFLALSRRLDGPDGRFAGVVLAVLPLAALAEVVTPRHLYDDGAVGVAMGDGRLLLWMPESAPAVPDLFGFLRSAGGTGRHGAPVRLSVDPDGRQRIGAAVSVPGFDAHVVVTYSEPDLLARLWLPKSLVLGAVALLSLVALWWVVLRLEHAEDRERAAREAASASAREVRSIVEHLDEVVWSADPDTWEVAYVSPACERVYGRTAEAFRGDRNLWLAAIHPEDRERVEALHRATDHRVDSFDARYRIVRPDGAVAWVRDKSHGVLGPDGRLERIDGIVTDVTDKVAALEELAASRSSLEAVVQATVDALVTIDEDGRIETFNEAARRMFGYAPEEVIGRNVTVLMPDGHATRHSGYMRNYMDTGVARIIGIGREVEGRRRDGSQFPLDLSVGEWRAGGRRHFTAVMRDLTRRREIEAALRRAQRLEAVGRLTSGIAHDFNNLLTPIAGYASLMAEGVPEGSQEREDLEVILRAASRGRDLVAQMMAFAREDSPVPTPVPIDEAIAEAVRLVAPTVPGGVDLRVLSPGEGLSVLADRQRLGRLLLNLLSNALHAMEGRRGAVTIRAERRPGPGGSWRDDPPVGAWVAILVEDDGSGMAPEVVDRAFEPFFTTKPVGRGTGLGLATAHGDVSGWGGEIRIDSRPDHGTRVEVLLRGADATAVASARTDAATTDDRPKGIAGRALVVDDDPDVRAVAMRMLERLGLATTTTDGVAAALALLDAPGTAGFDLVLTDLTMPGRPVTELIERIRAGSRGTRTVVMSGGASVADDCRRLGVPFVRKPLSLPELEAVLTLAPASGETVG